MSEGIMLFSVPSTDHTGANDERDNRAKHKRPMRREVREQKSTV